MDKEQQERLIQNTHSLLMIILDEQLETAQQAPESPKKAKALAVAERLEKILNDEMEERFSINDYLRAFFNGTAQPSNKIDDINRRYMLMSAGPKHPGDGLQEQLEKITHLEKIAADGYGFLLPLHAIILAEVCGTYKDPEFLQQVQEQRKRTKYAQALEILRAIDLEAQTNDGKKDISEGRDLISDIAAKLYFADKAPREPLKKGPLTEAEVDAIKDYYYNLLAFFTWQQCGDDPAREWLEWSHSRTAQLQGATRLTVNTLAGKSGLLDTPNFKCVLKSLCMTTLDNGIVAAPPATVETFANVVQAFIEAVNHDGNFNPYRILTIPARVFYGRGEMEFAEQRQKQQTGKLETRGEARLRELSFIATVLRNTAALYYGQNTNLFTRVSFDPAGSCIDIQSPIIMDMLAAVYHVTYIPQSAPQLPERQPREPYKINDLVKPNTAATARRGAAGSHAAEMARAICYGLKARGITTPDSKLPANKGTKWTGDRANRFTYTITAGGLIAECPKLQAALNGNGPAPRTAAERKKDAVNKNAILRRAFAQLEKTLKNETWVFNYFDRLTIAAGVPDKAGKIQKTGGVFFNQYDAPTSSTVNKYKIVITHYGRNPVFAFPAMPPELARIEEPRQPATPEDTTAHKETQAVQEDTTPQPAAEPIRAATGYPTGII